jgi:SAM-dependent methyltransferase
MLMMRLFQATTTRRRCSPSASLAVITVVVLIFGDHAIHGLQPPPPLPPVDPRQQPQQRQEEEPGLLLRSRRDAVIIAGGTAVASYFYAKTVQSVLDPPIVYPAAHEDRVRNMIRTTLTAAAASITSQQQLPGQQGRPLHLLEVGIGTTARLIRRDLYEFGNDNDRKMIQMVGLDPHIPTSPDVLRDMDLHLPTSVTLELRADSICAPPTAAAFPNGYFDAIVCCFTLCSVEDPETALVEMKRLLRPNGGVLGYCEHVAAAPEDDDNSFFGMGRQQVLLDPLQQRLADSCHLHRPTPATIRQVFDSSTARYLLEQDFMVPAMWPVSVQSCGVLQMI